MITRFTNDARREYFLANRNKVDDDNNAYNKKLYKKSTWQPPLASKQVETCLSNFADTLKQSSMQAIYLTAKCKPFVSSTTTRISS